MSILVRFVLPIIMCLSFYDASAWGAKGHAMVGRLAMTFVKPDVKQNILNVLNGMSIDTAANWMDIMKSDNDYDFMRSWHYIDFPKNQTYTPDNNENIVNRLLLSSNELKHKKILCDAQIKTDLLVLLHLMGDLHMPLHTGYDDDLGGNKTIVQFDTIKTHNLHTFWDEDIIRLSNITDADCLNLLTKASFDTIKSIDFVAWMKDSRSLLNQVYDFPDYTLDKAYLEKNRIVVQNQLLKAGLRLAYVLNQLFPSPDSMIDFSIPLKNFKKGIDIKDASINIGKSVVVCSRVFGVRSTNTITQINVGAKFPNNPLTIIIFAKNYSKFKEPFEALFTDKNICVKGVITEYKGKPQIVIEDPGDITFL